MTALSDALAATQARAVAALAKAHVGEVLSDAEQAADAVRDRRADEFERGLDCA